MRRERRVTGLAGDIALGSRQGSSDVVRRKSRQFRVRLLDVDVTGLAGHVELDRRHKVGTRLRHRTPEFRLV